MLHPHPGRQWVRLRILNGDQWKESTEVHRESDKDHEDMDAGSGRHTDQSCTRLVGDHFTVQLYLYSGENLKKIAQQFFLISL